MGETQLARGIHRRDDGLMLGFAIATDHQRQMEVLALHLAGHVDHLVQRRRDQTG